jgi:MinD superfamily P-loop ATPase
VEPHKKAGAQLKEIVIISGKGGTGKTTVAASFAALARGNAVFADCDVDAADLHLILKPSIQRRIAFRSGHKAIINPDICTGCGVCKTLCRFNAITESKSKDNNSKKTMSVVPFSCEGCGVCVRFCPSGAIDFPEQKCGEWFVSDTRFGTLVHAELGIGAENSGKLVTLVRNEAKKIAQEQQSTYVIIDGSPGIGCPVIASLTASSVALIVTEPTVSGDHDLRRIAQLTKQLGVPAMICVNKWDINPSSTEAIRNFTESAGLLFAGIVRYDSAVSEAQRAEKSIVEYCDTPLAEDIRQLWKCIENFKAKATS